jgi:hypothetical protein
MGRVPTLAAVALLCLVLAVVCEAKKAHHRAHHKAHKAHHAHHTRRHAIQDKADAIKLNAVPVATVAATKAWSASWLATLAKAPPAPLCYFTQQPDSRMHPVTQVTSELEKVNKWRCQGCQTTVTTLVNFMKPLLASNATNPRAYVDAYQAFGQTCQYVDNEFTEVCQYMFENLATDVPSMIMQEMLPIDICACVGACRPDERDVYIRAFQSITATEPTAAPLPQTPGGYPLAAKTANKAFQVSMQASLTTKPPQPLCYANQQPDRRAFAVTSVHSEHEQVNKWRCDGCVASVNTLFDHIRPVLQQGGSMAPLAAAQQFGQACQYVQTEFVEVCQYMFEVYPQQTVAMIYQDILPLDLCVCLQHCRNNERDYYISAFRTISN